MWDKNNKEVFNLCYWVGVDVFDYRRIFRRRNKFGKENEFSLWFVEMGVIFDIGFSMCLEIFREYGVWVEGGGFGRGWVYYLI